MGDERTDGKPSFEDFMKELREKLLLHAEELKKTDEYAGREEELDETVKEALEKLEEFFKLSFSFLEGATESLGELMTEIVEGFSESMSNMKDSDDDSE
ncbi:MAG: hypothetical protein FWG41_05455 [Methanomassiliicoccaceae archaeon]|nr:hypothetical protein [Methanomassiliicoccaceae archaeon]